MSNRWLKLWIIPFFLLSFSSHAEENIAAKGTISFNVGELAGFTIASLTLFGDISCKKGPTGPYPFHFDGSFKVNETWAVDAGVVYRFENYGCGQNETKRSGIDTKFLWTNYHELFFMGGARYSPLSTGLDGLYLSAKAGPGFGFSQGGHAITVTVQPEVGYAWNFFGTPGLHLQLGLGVLANIPVSENPWLGWKRLSFFPGWVVHRLIPIINVGIGMSF